MPSAALSSVGVPLMGMFFAPATHVGVIDKAPRKQLSDSVRDSIRRGQGGRCAKCGKRFYEGNMEVDHRWPVAKGGQNWMINLQALCRTCNRSKGAKLEPVIGDVLSTAFAALPLAAISGLPGQVLSFMEFGALVEAGTALTGQAGALIPFIAVTPTTAILIVGGVVLVVVGAFAVKWLLQHADGERRYLRLARSVREAMSGFALRAAHLARHFEGVPDQARRNQSQIGDSARRVGASAGTAVGHARRAGAQQVPRMMSRAEWLLQRVSQVPEHVASRVPSDMGNTARRLAGRGGPALAHVQEQFGGMASRMPRVRKRAPAAGNGDMEEGRWV